MKKALILLCLFLTGCASGNFSPRLRQNNDVPNGDVKNNQSGVMVELGNLKKQTEILQSKLKEVQDGLINLNAAVSRNENTGIQILQGDGALFLVFSSIVVAFLFYSKSKKSQEVAKILTQKIVEFNNPELTGLVVDEFSKKQKSEFLKILKKLN